MEKIIGVDLDEVLSQTLDDALKYNKYMFNGIPIKRKDVLNYYIHQIPKYNAGVEDSKQWFDNFLASKKANSLKPVTGAKRKLMELKKKGYSLVVVTARPEEFKDMTWKWVNRHFTGIFDDMVFANHLTKNAVSKVDLCKNLGIQIMIEDNLHYATELAKAGIKVYLFDKPRNQEYNPKIHKNIVKVKKWKDIDL
ncbi:MAG: hypothetical protein CO170_00600 [candidate division SR1 bacterium CG_4_9_14_3_um_filter_40_9]|nr:MAG: hypothetical protein CO170_00600 [candidate division SR1 bacterium CG_4_9_14_3_um_filter_40_9]